MTSIAWPLVSVVVPTYNRSHLICETLQSVLTQSYSNLELIVVDDGSTDDPQERVLQTFGEDPRVRYVSQENGERAVARNRGIRESCGEYIAFMDSDDLWLPSKLERQMAVLLAPDAPECCFCLYDVFSNDDRTFESGSIPPSGDIFEDLLYRCFIGSMTPVIHRTCFEKVGTFCEDRRLLCFEDWEMWTRLACAYRWAIVPEVLCRYRLHPGNTQHAADHQVDEIRMRLMVRYSLSEQKNKSLKRYLLARRWHWAAFFYKTNPWITLAFLRRIALQAPVRMIDRAFWGLLMRALVQSCSLRS